MYTYMKDILKDICIYIYMIMIMIMIIISYVLLLYVKGLHMCIALDK